MPRAKLAVSREDAAEGNPFEFNPDGDRSSMKKGLTTGLCLPQRKRKNPGEEVPEDVLKTKQSKAEDSQTNEPSEEEDDEPEAPTSSGDMAKLLQSFGVGVKNVLTSKKRKVRSLTTNICKNSTKRMETLFTKQHKEREAASMEYQNQISEVFKQWELDLERTKDQEDELQNLIAKQQKLCQQKTQIQKQRISSLRRLFQQFNKSCEDIEQSHQEESSAIQNDMKKELENLQKKILVDTHTQEMENVKKSLHSLLFS